MNIHHHVTSAGTVSPFAQLATSAPGQSAGAQLLARPEFYTFSKRAKDDPFKLSRSTYYDLERAGLLRMVRLRKPGNLRGKVLIPYEAVRALLAKMNQEH